MDELHLVENYPANLAWNAGKEGRAGRVGRAGREGRDG